MNSPSLNRCVNDILSFQDQTEKTIQSLVQRNSDLTKIIASVRSSLERSLKNHSTLNDAVYECIDLCRANFIYMDYSSGKTKRDPPLTEQEKTLPIITEKHNNGGQNKLTK